MTVLFLILYLLAGVFFGLAAANQTVGRLNPLALGLLCWVVVLIIQTAQRL